MIMFHVNLQGCSVGNLQVVTCKFRLKELWGILFQNYQVGGSKNHPPKMKIWHAVDGRNPANHLECIKKPL